MYKDLISKLKTPEECEQVAKNATERGCVDLALQAKKRAIALRAEIYGATTDVERAGEAVERSRGRMLETSPD